MSTAKDTSASVSEAVRLSERVNEARAMARQLEAVRDAAIRRAAAEGASRADLARQVGISRARLYVVLDEPAEDDFETFTWLQDAEQEAYERWDANDQKGSPDDYWPSSL